MKNKLFNVEASLKRFSMILLFSCLFMAGYGTSFVKPDGNKTEFKPGEYVELEWTRDQYVKRFDITIAFIGDNGGTNLIRQTYQVNDCSSDIPDNTYSFTIPCSFTGKIAISIRSFEDHNTPFCERTDHDVINRDFTVYPVKLVPPLPKAELLCGPQEDHIITIPNPDHYDDVRWYAGPTTSAPFHNGFSYTQDFSSTTPYTYWVSYVWTSPQGCFYESERLPVAVFVLPAPPPPFVFPPDGVGIEESTTCDPLDATTHYDLSADLSAYTNEINSINTSYCEASFDAKLTWDPVPTYVSNNGVGIYRVCNSNLPPGGGTSRTFHGNLNVSADVKLKNDNGDVVYAGSASCMLPIVETTVYKRLKPPMPKGVFFCSTGTKTFTIENPYGYAAARFYTDPASTSYVESSTFSYSRNYPAEGVYPVYVSYVANGRESVKSFVKVVVLPSTPMPPMQRAYVNFAPAVDNCNLPGGYHDLDVDPSSVVNFLSNFITTLNNSNNDMKVTASYSVQWEPVGYYTVITNNGVNTYRVCSSNLPAGNGTCRLYRAYLTVNATVDIYENNKLLSSTTHNCTYGPIKRVMVCKFYLTTVNCDPDFGSATTVYGPDNTCTSVEQQVLRKDGDVVTIGATFTSIPAYTYSYSWSPAAGLNDATAQYPTVSYSSIPVSNGQFMKYKCTVTGTPPVTGLPMDNRVHCVYIYKCATRVMISYQDIENISPLRSAGEEETVEPDNEPVIFAPSDRIVLYPNPVSEELYIDYTLRESTGSKLIIRNMLGQVVHRLNLEVQNGAASVSVGQLIPGMYIIQIVQADKVVLTDRFSVVR